MAATQLLSASLLFLLGMLALQGLLQVADLFLEANQQFRPLSNLVVSSRPQPFKQGTQDCDGFSSAARLGLLHFFESRCQRAY